MFSDLSYYNQDYPNSIRDIINSHLDYSYMGDVNLNGMVSGTGTGSRPPTTSRRSSPAGDTTTAPASATSIRGRKVI